MSIFKGRLDSSNLFVANDDIRGLRLLSVDSIPAYLDLESGDGGENYLWWDDSENLRMATSAPTAANRNTAGSVIVGAANSGANRALSNLSSVAVNTSLLMADNIGITLGTSADITFLWDGTDGELDFAAANSMLNIGQTQPSDISIFGAGSELIWDASADIFTVMDSGFLAFGDADDVLFSWDATDFEWDFAAANSVVQFGATQPSDFRFHGSTAGSDILWDASADTMYFFDDTLLGFGDGIDMYLNFNATDLELRQTVAGTGNFKIGVDDAGIDVTLYSDTAGDYIKWDASADLLIFEDTGTSFVGANTDYQLMISTDALLLDEVNDHANGSLVFGATGTNGLNVTFQGQASGDTMVFDAGAGTFTLTDIQAVLTGADSSGTLLTITGIDTTGNTDTVAITSSGTGAGLKVTAGEVDSLNMALVAIAAQTVSMLQIDGSTGTGWDGADNVGMLHLVSDSVHVHAGASMLYVANSAQSIASAEGTLARFLNTGAAQAGAVMVEMSAKDATEYALKISSGLMDVTEHIIAKGYEHNVTTRIATDAGDGTAICVAGEGFIQATETTGDDGDILQLAAGLAGMIVWIYNNDAAQDFVVEPFGTEQINGGGAGVGVTIGQKTALRLVCVEDGLWIGNNYLANGTEAAAS